MSLLITLRSERLKTKRTAAIYVTIFAALFAPLMSMLDAVFGEGVSAEGAPTIFNRMLTDKFEMTGLVVLPVFIILICTLLAQIEYRNHAWKQVFASPQKKADVFVSKFIVANGLLILFLLINLLGLFLTVVVLHYKHPSFNVLGQPVDVSEIIATRLNAYGAMLAMIALQFWLSLRFKNFIAAIAIGLSCWIVGTLSVMEYHFSATEYFPYSFHIFANLSEYKSILNRILWTSGIYAIIFLVLAFIDFNRRGVKA